MLSVVPNGSVIYNMKQRWRTELRFTLNFLSEPHLGTFSALSFTMIVGVNALCTKTKCLKHASVQFETSQYLILFNLHYNTRNNI